jgi:hypothetical protein
MSSNSLNFSPSVRPSIFYTLEKVKLQVDYHAFADLKWKIIDPLYNEMCLIISEVLVMNPESNLKVNGSVVKAYLVQDVFNQLRHDHVHLVFQNFQYATYQVYYKKAYLRTALYNAFFEIESHHGGLGYFND